MIAPVYGEPFADLFVLAVDGAYYAYGTLPVRGRTVPALTSTNLVDWRPLGEVLEPLPHEVENYWAPEVAVEDGRFYMYYSAGGEEGEGHQLRVATSDRPEGPFADSGRVLDPDEPFSIDAHPFRDDDGRWYLFYCRDFLEDERPGTGIVADELVDMTTLAGERQDVVRPFADWNLFLKDRYWYGRTWPGWYTVEGPFVRKREGRYYLFFSGGAWRETNYGLSYAVASHPLGPWELVEHDGPSLLRTVPDRILGPGHASITTSPSGESEYLVYHAWDPGRAARLMRIDGFEWKAVGPRWEGPTVDPQPLPR